MILFFCRVEGVGSSVVYSLLPVPPFPAPSTTQLAEPNTRLPVASFLLR
ncbi:MAG: hypothetical protein F6J98_02750 [Moorea sp. SIO4G2]|nr:hypothetical protein [Moorena sp. SIO4A3]NEO59373.1 hypothetical protein [Moorena sp. SIO4G2]